VCRPLSRQFAICTTPVGDKQADLVCLGDREMFVSLPSRFGMLMLAG